MDLRSMEKKNPSWAYVKLGEGVFLFSRAHLDRYDPLAHHSGWLHSATPRWRWGEADADALTSSSSSPQQSSRGGSHRSPSPFVAAPIS